MSFFKSWFGKLDPDPVVEPFPKELNEVSVQVDELKAKFVTHLNALLAFAHTGKDLAETMDKFNQRLRPNHPPTRTFLKVQNMFYSQIADTWAKRYRDEVVYMMEHWKNQAEAQQSFITNFERARQQCETIKSQLLTLQEQKLKCVEKNRPAPEQLLQELAEATANYRKYEGLLDSMRNSVKAQQNKLTGPVGQFLSFDIALTSFFELYVALEREMRAATESYYPFLPTTRKDMLLNSPSAGAYVPSPTFTPHEGVFAGGMAAMGLGRERAGSFFGGRERSGSSAGLPPVSLGTSANGLDEAALSRALGNLRGMATFLAETHADQYESFGNMTPSSAVKKTRELSLLLSQFQLEGETTAGRVAPVSSPDEQEGEADDQNPEGSEASADGVTPTVRFVAARRRKSNITSEAESGDMDARGALRARHEAFLQATSSLVLRNQDGSVAITPDQSDLAEHTLAGGATAPNLGVSHQVDVDLKDIELRSWEFAAGKRRPLRDLLAALHLVIWSGASWQPVTARQIKSTPDLFAVAQTAIVMAAAAADIPFPLPTGEFALPASDEALMASRTSVTPQAQGTARRVAMALRTALQTEVDADGGAFWLPYEFLEFQQRDQQEQRDRQKRLSVVTLGGTVSSPTGSVSDITSPVGLSLGASNPVDARVLTPESSGSAATSASSTSLGVSPTTLASMRTVFQQQAPAVISPTSERMNQSESTPAGPQGGSKSSDLASEIKVNTTKGSAEAGPVDADDIAEELP